MATYQPLTPGGCSGGTCHGNAVAGGYFGDEDGIVLNGDLGDRDAYASEIAGIARHEGPVIVRPSFLRRTLADYDARSGA